MKHLIACICIASACATASFAADQDFKAVANAYIERMLETDPEMATMLGDHRYDGRLTDRSEKAIAERNAINRSYREKLSAIDLKTLSSVNAVDYRILVSSVDRMIFEAEELREHEWNPLAYNMGNAIYALIAREFAPLPARLQSVEQRLAEIPDVIAAARANLKNPPRVHTETAILQNQGNIVLVRDELSAFASEADMDNAFAPAQEAAVAALEVYGQWLEDDLLPRSTGEFRLGEEMWRKKLRYTLASDLSKEEILERALADLAATQQKMYETALPLYRGYYPDADDEEASNVTLVNKAVLDRLAQRHPTNDSIVDRARATLTEATEFARVRGLVTVPDEPVRLIVMPEFQRGVAVAYCDAPGPLDIGQETFYAISPTPADWSAERTESFFREYNDFMIYDLTVHEAVPGHYLQLAHSNRFSAPTMVRAIFQSGLFIEGWAVYSEEVMADADFGGPEVRMQQLKMRLRVLINAVIDQEIHCDGMNESAAIAMMMEEGYQEEGEATGKWRRACLTSTQLSTYFVGSEDVKDIVRAYRARAAKNGAEVDLRRMHDAILSFGSPPPRYVRESLGL